MVLARAELPQGAWELATMRWFVRVTRVTAVVLSPVLTERHPSR